MGLPGVLWLGGCACRDISHLSCPLLLQDAPIWFWTETLPLDLWLPPPQLGRGFCHLEPVGVQLRNGGWVTPGPE